MERFQRMLPPSFKGESDPLLAESWMREIEKIFRAIRCADEDKVTLATYMLHMVLMSGVLQERVDVWWASLLRTRFEDGAIDVAWDEFVRLFRAKFVPEHIQDRMEQEFLSLAQGSMTVLEYETRFSELSKYAAHIVADERRKTKKFVMGLKPSLRTRLVAFDHRTLDEALSAACRQEGEMEQYLEEKKASQKRPAATFQRQDKKKAVYQTQQRSVAVGNAQVPSVRSPGVKKECPHCGKTHGGSECWMITGKCLKCGSSDHKIKDCPRLQQGVQRGAPAPAAVAAAAPATGRPGRPRAPARMKDYEALLGLYWLEEHYASVDCRRKRIVFRIPGEDEFSHPLPRNLAGKMVISAMKAMRMGKTLTAVSKTPPLQPLIRRSEACSGHLPRQGGSWNIEKGIPDLDLLWRLLKNPGEGNLGSFLGLPKESITNPFNPFGEFLKGKIKLRNRVVSEMLCYGIDFDGFLLNVGDFKLRKEALPTR
ncbi:hypothetical protein Taro_051495 [Colocasia esculenta]|uniref:CCHC-type domain-containing protein n=1 Tax=Colocasia esculenta TaxID=4460 RepID=A0A843XH05_COLES|nr:hypothetical protein [Colocasia esculenta]